MENNEILLEDEDMQNILTLTDENGDNVDFEYLDLVEYQGREFVILLPVDDDAGELVILEVIPVDEENESYVAVSDDATLNAVYGIFKERFKDILDFAD
jgi:uncharacterized protein YrzB (UPF0473 family)